MNYKLCLKSFWVTLMLFTVSQLMAQTSEVRGTLFEPDGSMTLVGATIIEKGNPNNGTISNMDGKYTIKVTGKDPVLIFQCVGYETQEIPVKGRTTINVTMQESTIQIGRAHV